MSSNPLKRVGILDSVFAKNLFKLIIFSLAGGLFASIEFPVYNSDGLNSNFGEIPLIISTIFFRNPLYILLTICTTFFISTLGPEYYAWGISLHFVALVPIWYLYHYLIKDIWLRSNSKKVSFALGSVLLYYFIFLIPLIVLKDTIELSNSSFLLSYGDLVKQLRIEIYTTTICVALIFLYYMNFLKLKQHSEDLEIKNEKLAGYAFINSHLLRAPLTRIIGLSMLFKKGDHEANEELVPKLQESCQELDDVVRLVNKYVTEESVHENEEMESLLKDISKDYYAIVNRKKQLN